MAPFPDFGGGPPENRNFVHSKLDEHELHHKHHFQAIHRHEVQIAVLSTRLLMLWISLGFLGGLVVQTGATYFLNRVAQVQAAPATQAAK